MGVSRTNAFESGIDFVEERLEADRDSAARAEQDAIEAAASVSSRLTDAVADKVARELARARASYADADERLAIIATYGRPLARRAGLLDAIRNAEAEKREAMSAVVAAEAEVARCRPRPTGDDVDALGAAASRSSAYSQMSLATDRRRRAEAELVVQRVRLGTWELEHPAIFESLFR